MSDYSNLFEMLGNSGFGCGTGACPPPPGPGPCPPPPGPGPCPPPCPPPVPPIGPGFGGNGILLWLIVLYFFGFGRGGCGFGVGNNSGCNNNCGNSCGNNCGCGNMMCGYDTGCCTTMMPNPCDYTEYCNCCGKRVKKCKKQKNYIVEMCQCGGCLPVTNENCGCGNIGFGCGNGYGCWWIIILIILFCFRGGNGLLCGTQGVPFQGQRPVSCEC